MTTVALRTSLIWHDEVMEDLVAHKPMKITVGNTGTPTFVVPNVGLPKDFAIVRPGNRGYLLTLGERMRGTICIDGEQKDVEELVRNTNAGGFSATPISGKDWGVIDLDESGDYKVFFQFVPVEDHQPFFSKPVLLAGFGGYFLSMLVLGIIFWATGIRNDYEIAGSPFLGDIAECLFRGWGISTAALGVSGVGFALFKSDPDNQASFGFSILMHAALLFMTYQLYDGNNPFEWPGPRALTGNYLVTRLETEEPEPPKPVLATVSSKQDSGAAAPKSPEKPKNTATKNPEGAAGGKGEVERARDPNAKDTPPAPPRVALFEDKNRKVLDNIIDRNLSTSLSKFSGIKGDEVKRGDLGFGPGTGTGVGAGHGTGTTRGSKGTGTGGGGNAEGDFVSNKGKIDMGKDRPGGGTCAKPPCGTSPKEVKVTLAEPEGDFGGLTAEEINRVVKSRAGVFRACYQGELNRSPGIGGKLIVHFSIGGDGIVKNAKTAGGSSLRNAAVEQCVTSNIMRLKFPAKGGIANVNYPFLFQPGG
ncbi:MAG: AgmX/PglI C-terminal domain-containing protein [Kofleriaceae bacterium]|nr:AgmX/PglI C-terminal domain-containing protein [Kofleriaceae bacterium]